MEVELHKPRQEMNLKLLLGGASSDEVVSSASVQLVTNPKKITTKQTSTMNFLDGDCKIL